MSRRLDGKTIQPSDLTPAFYAGSSIVENIILASSNKLRAFLGLSARDCIPGPIPKFVTRKNPSLDNYFADLLLRTCYEPIDYLPIYEEHVMRGSQIELPSDLNPRLVNSVLIGIGGMSTNPEFLRVYDEHGPGGTRRADSVSQVVFDQHLSRFTKNHGVQSLSNIFREINIRDSGGGSSGLDLYTITKRLHLAQFRQPGFVAESLDAQWKRAIIGAILMSSIVCDEDWKDYDDSKALASLEDEWRAYLKKSEVMADKGYIDRVAEEVISHIQKPLLTEKEMEVKGEKSNLSPKRILFSLKRVWHPQVVSFIIGFLFESLLQAQHGYLDIYKKVENGKIPIRTVRGHREAFVYYQKEPRDKTPHAAILGYMNADHFRPVIVVIHDPVIQVTSIFTTNNKQFKPKWKKFHQLLIEKEGGDVWYTPTKDDGDIATFILNGTESFLGVPMTNLEEDDYFELFKKALE